ncbi:unnamed protein product, partial [Nesidiocoris tenuis]
SKWEYCHRPEIKNRNGASKKEINFTHYSKSLPEHVSVVIYKNGHSSLNFKRFFKFLKLKCLSRQDLTPCLIGI